MPKDEEEVIDDTTETDTEDETTTDDDKGGEEEQPKDETPAWAKTLVEGQTKINERLEALEKGGKAEDEDADDEEDDDEEETEKPTPNMTVEQLEQRIIKNTLKAIEGREKEKTKSVQQVEEYYNNQIATLEKAGKDVSVETQREVFKHMRDNKITSFIEGYYLWESSGGKPKGGKDEEEIDDEEDRGIVNKNKEKSRRIASPGGDRKANKGGKVYRPGQTVHDVLADIFAEEDQQ